MADQPVSSEGLAMSQDPDGAAAVATPERRRPSLEELLRRKSESPPITRMDFENALVLLKDLEKKLRVEMLQNIRELRLNMTQRRIDAVTHKAAKLYNIRRQLTSSKILYRQEKEIMAEFEKIKALLLLPEDMEEVKWVNTKEDCQFLGDQLQKVRRRQRRLSGQVEDLEATVANLLTLPMDELDLSQYDIEQLRREEEEYDRMFPALSSYPLFNSAPYGRDLMGRSKAGSSALASSAASFTTSPNPSGGGADLFGGIGDEDANTTQFPQPDKLTEPAKQIGVRRQRQYGEDDNDIFKEQRAKFDSWLAEKEAMLKKEAEKREREEEGEADYERDNEKGGGGGGGKKEEEEVEEAARMEKDMTHLEMQLQRLKQQKVEEAELIRRMEEERRQMEEEKIRMEADRIEAEQRSVKKKIEVGDKAVADHVLEEVNIEGKEKMKPEEVEMAAEKTKAPEEKSKEAVKGGTGEKQEKGPKKVVKKKKKVIKKPTKENETNEKSSDKPSKKKQEDNKTESKKDSSALEKEDQSRKDDKETMEEGLQGDPALPAGSSDIIEGHEEEQQLASMEATPNVVSETETLADSEALHKEQQAAEQAEENLRLENATSVDINLHQQETTNQLQEIMDSSSSDKPDEIFEQESVAIDSFIVEGTEESRPLGDSHERAQEAQEEEGAKSRRTQEDNSPTEAEAYDIETMAQDELPLASSTESPDADEVSVEKVVKKRTLADWVDPSQQKKGDALEHSEKDDNTDVALQEVNENTLKDEKGIAKKARDAKKSKELQKEENDDQKTKEAEGKQKKLKEKDKKLLSEKDRKKKKEEEERKKKESEKEEKAKKQKEAKEKKAALEKEKKRIQKEEKERKAKKEKEEKEKKQREEQEKREQEEREKMEKELEKQDKIRKFEEKKQQEMERKQKLEESRKSNDHLNKSQVSLNKSEEITNTSEDSKEGSQQASKELDSNDLDVPTEAQSGSKATPEERLEETQGSKDLPPEISKVAQSNLKESSESTDHLKLEAENLEQESGGVSEPMPQNDSKDSTEASSSAKVFNQGDDASASRSDQHLQDFSPDDQGVSMGPTEGEDSAVKKPPRKKKKQPKEPKEPAKEQQPKVDSKSELKVETNHDVSSPNPIDLPSQPPEKTETATPNKTTSQFTEDQSEYALTEEQQLAAALELADEIDRVANQVVKAEKTSADNNDKTESQYSHTQVISKEKGEIVTEEGQSNLQPVDEINVDNSSEMVRDATEIQPMLPQEDKASFEQAEAVLTETADEIVELVSKGLEGEVGEAPLTIDDSQGSQAAKSNETDFTREIASSSRNQLGEDDAIAEIDKVDEIPQNDSHLQKASIEQETIALKAQDVTITASGESAEVTVEQLDGQNIPKTSLQVDELIDTASTAEQPLTTSDKYVEELGTSDVNDGECKETLKEGPLKESLIEGAPTDDASHRDTVSLKTPDEKDVSEPDRSQGHFTDNTSATLQSDEATVGTQDVVEESAANKLDQDPRREDPSKNQSQRNDGNEKAPLTQSAFEEQDVVCSQKQNLTGITLDKMEEVTGAEESQQGATESQDDQLEKATAISQNLDVDATDSNKITRQQDSSKIDSDSKPVEEPFPPSLLQQEVKGSQDASEVKIAAMPQLGAALYDDQQKIAFPEEQDVLAPADADLHAFLKEPGSKGDNVQNHMNEVDELAVQPSVEETVSEVITEKSHVSTDKLSLNEISSDGTLIAAIEQEHKEQTNLPPELVAEKAGLTSSAKGPVTEIMHSKDAKESVETEHVNQNKGFQENLIEGQQIRDKEKYFAEEIQAGESAQVLAENIGSAIPDKGVEVSRGSCEETPISTNRKQFNEDQNSDFGQAAVEAMGSVKKSPHELIPEFKKEIHEAIAFDDEDLVRQKSAVEVGSEIHSQTSFEPRQEATGGVDEGDSSIQQEDTSVHKDPRSVAVQDANEQSLGKFGEGDGDIIASKVTLENYSNSDASKLIPEIKPDQLSTASIDVESSHPQMIEETHDHHEPITASNEDPTTALPLKEDLFSQQSSEGVAKAQCLEASDSTDVAQAAEAQLKKPPRKKKSAKPDQKAVEQEIRMTEVAKSDEVVSKLPVETPEEEKVESLSVPKRKSDRKAQKGQGESRDVVDVAAEENVIEARPTMDLGAHDVAQQVLGAPFNEERLDFERDVTNQVTTLESETLEYEDQEYQIERAEQMHRRREEIDEMGVVQMTEEEARYREEEEWLAEEERRLREEGWMEQGAEAEPLLTEEEIAEEEARMEAEWRRERDAEDRDRQWMMEEVRRMEEERLEEEARMAEEARRQREAWMGHEGDEEEHFAMQEEEEGGIWQQGSVGAAAQEMVQQGALVTSDVQEAINQEALWEAPVEQQTGQFYEPKQEFFGEKEELQFEDQDQGLVMGDLARQSVAEHDGTVEQETFITDLLREAPELQSQLEAASASHSTMIAENVSSDPIDVYNFPEVAEMHEAVEDVEDWQAMSDLAVTGKGYDEPTTGNIIKQEIAAAKQFPESLQGTEMPLETDVGDQTLPQWHEQGQGAEGKPLAQGVETKSRTNNSQANESDPVDQAEFLMQSTNLDVNEESHSPKFVDVTEAKILPAEKEPKKAKRSLHDLDATEMKTESHEGQGKPMEVDESSKPLELAEAGQHEGKTPLVAPKRKGGKGTSKQPKASESQIEHIKQGEEKESESFEVLKSESVKKPKKSLSDMIEAKNKGALIELQDGENAISAKAAGNETSMAPVDELPEEQSQRSLTDVVEKQKVPDYPDSSYLNLKPDTSPSPQEKVQRPKRSPSKGAKVKKDVSKPSDDIEASDQQICAVDVEPLEDFSKPQRDSRKPKRTLNEITRADKAAEDLEIGKEEAAGLMEEPTTTSNSQKAKRSLADMTKSDSSTHEITPTNNLEAPEATVQRPKRSSSKGTKGKKDVSKAMDVEALGEIKSEIDAETFADTDKDKSQKDSRKSKRTLNEIAGLKTEKSTGDAETGNTPVDDQGGLEEDSKSVIKSKKNSLKSKRLGATNTAHEDQNDKKSGKESTQTQEKVKTVRSKKSVEETNKNKKGVKAPTQAVLDQQKESPQRKDKSPETLKQSVPGGKDVTQFEDETVTGNNSIPLEPTDIYAKIKPKKEASKKVDQKLGDVAKSLKGSKDVQEEAISPERPQPRKRRTASEEVKTRTATDASKKMGATVPPPPSKPASAKQKAVGGNSPRSQSENRPPPLETHFDCEEDVAQVKIARKPESAKPVARVAPQKNVSAASKDLRRPEAKAKTPPKKVSAKGLKTAAQLLDASAGSGERSPSKPESLDEAVKKNADQPAPVSAAEQNANSLTGDEYVERERDDECVEDERSRSSDALANANPPTAAPVKKKMSLQSKIAGGKKFLQAKISNNKEENKVSVADVSANAESEEKENVKEQTNKGSISSKAAQSKTILSEMSVPKQKRDRSEDPNGGRKASMTLREKIEQGRQAIKGRSRSVAAQQRQPQTEDILQGQEPQADLDAPKKKSLQEKLSHGKKMIKDAQKQIQDQAIARQEVLRQQQEQEELERELQRRSRESEPKAKKLSLQEKLGQRGKRLIRESQQAVQIVRAVSKGEEHRAPLRDGRSVDSETLPITRDDDVPTDGEREMASLDLSFERIYGGGGDDASLASRDEPKPTLPRKKHSSTKSRSPSSESIKIRVVDIATISPPPPRSRSKRREERSSTTRSSKSPVMKGDAIQSRSRSHSGDGRDYKQTSSFSEKPPAPKATQRKPSQDRKIKGGTKMSELFSAISDTTLAAGRKARSRSRGGIATVTNGNKMLPDFGDNVCDADGKDPIYATVSRGRRNASGQASPVPPPHSPAPTFSTFLGPDDATSPATAPKARKRSKERRLTGTVDAETLAAAARLAMGPREEAEMDRGQVEEEVRRKRRRKRRGGRREGRGFGTVDSGISLRESSSGTLR